VSTTVGFNRLKTDIEKSTNIYDILAAANIALGPYSPTIESSFNRRNYSDLIEHVNAFDHNEVTFPQFRDNVLTWLSSIDTASTNATSSYVYALIHCIDSIYSYKGYASGDPSESHKLEVISSLNDIYVNNMQILPRFEGNDNTTIAVKMYLSSKAERGFRERIPKESDDINSVLKNFDIFPRHFGKPSVKIHRFTTRISKQISERLNNKGDKLTVGLYPLWAGNLRKTWNIHYLETTFTITGMGKKEEERMLKRFKAALERCKKRGVDIAIFPELTMTRENLEEVQNSIKSMMGKCPILMVLGTIWEVYSENGIEFKQNVSVVMSNWGEILFEQQKQSSFLSQKPGHIYPEDGNAKGHKEELSFNEKTVNVIDIEGVGRFCTLICRDILKTTLISFMERLLADVVLVPAFSPSSNGLKTKLKSLVAGYRSTILLCNCCSALHAWKDKDEDYWIPKEILEKNIIREDKPDEKKEGVWELGFIMTPAKNKTSATDYVNPLNMSHSCINCQDNDVCHGGIFDIHYLNYLQPDSEKPGRIEIIRGST